MQETTVEKNAIITLGNGNTIPTDQSTANQEEDDKQDKKSENIDTKNLPHTTVSKRRRKRNGKRTFPLAFPFVICPTQSNKKNI